MKVTTTGEQSGACTDKSSLEETTTADERMTMTGTNNGNHNHNENENDNDNGNLIPPDASNNSTNEHGGLVASTDDTGIPSNGTTADTSQIVAKSSLPQSPSSSSSSHPELSLQKGENKKHPREETDNNNNNNNNEEDQCQKGTNETMGEGQPRDSSILTLPPESKKQKVISSTITITGTECTKDDEEKEKTIDDVNNKNGPMTAIELSKQDLTVPKDEKKDDVDIKKEVVIVDSQENSNATVQKEITSTSTSKHTSSRKVDPNVLEVRRKIQICCRDNDLETAMKHYQNAIDNGIKVEVQTFYNLLNLCDGLERSVHIGTPKGSDIVKTQVAPSQEIDNVTRQEYAFRIKDRMKELNLPLNENAYTALVKVLVGNKEYDMVETLLNESESVQQCKPRLRLYSSLLTAYCESRQMIRALQCWHRIVKQKLELTEKELLSLMKCAITTGDVAVFSRVLSDIAELVAVPSKDTVSAILQWFESPHVVFHEDVMRIPKHANEEKVKTLLEEIVKNEIEAPPSMEPIQTVRGWKTSSNVRIDSTSGKLDGGCMDKCTLKPVPLSERSWREMLQMNETIVLDGKVEGNTSKFQGGKKGQMRTNFNSEERKQHWAQFTEFLNSIGKIDVVVDAANVGYFKQNFASSPKHVDYDQINWVANKFIAMGKKVLLILHNRHFNPRMMPEKYKPLQEEWERKNILYKTPAGMNDDWFWLHAALKDRAMVLTNDEMRDHHFQMLAPSIFLRWKERHQIHFNFGNWQSNENSNGSSEHRGKRSREVILEFPPVYSRRIQRLDEGLVIPLIKSGDENRFLDGSHVADDDEPNEETYLCIRAIEDL